MSAGFRVLPLPRAVLIVADLIRWAEDGPKAPIPDIKVAERRLDEAKAFVATYKRVVAGKAAKEAAQAKAGSDAKP